MSATEKGVKNVYCLDVDALSDLSKSCFVSGIDSEIATSGTQESQLTSLMSVSLCT